MTREWLNILDIAARIALLVFALTLGTIFVVAGAKQALADKA